MAATDVRPAHGFDTLTPQDTLITHYCLELPPDLPSDSYEVLVALYYLDGEQVVTVESLFLPEPVVIGPESATSLGRS